MDGRWTANVVIHATGLFNRGKIHAIPGASKFKGQSWHTWPKDADIAGKRVAVIGTGPSSAQVIPAIQPLVKSLTVYQRGTTYCLPPVDYAYTRLQRFLFNYVPLVHFFYCLYLITIPRPIRSKHFGLAIKSRSQWTKPALNTLKLKSKTPSAAKNCVLEGDSVANGHSSWMIIIRRYNNNLMSNSSQIHPSKSLNPVSSPNLCASYHKQRRTKSSTKATPRIAMQS
jgi:hypothetical protein